MFKGDLRANLPRFFWLFMAGFLALIGVLAALALLETGIAAIAAVFVAATVLAFAVCGVLSATSEIEDWFVAGRQIPDLFNGMGMAAAWLSGSLFIALAGALVTGGQGWMALLVGWSGGLLLMAVLIAPYLRKTGAYTVPEFIAMRFGGGLTQLATVVVVVVVAFTVTAAQLGFAGLVAEQMIGVPYQLGVWLGLLAVLCATVPGGLRSATWVQVAQYCVLLVVFVVPLVWILFAGEADYPRFADAPATASGAVGAAAPAGEGAAAAGLDAWRFVALMLCSIAGAAVMPHLLINSFGASSSRGAGRTVAWSLLFVLTIALLAPGLAALVDVQVLDPALPGTLAGQPLNQVAAIDWVGRWIDLGALAIEDLNGDGTVQPDEITVGPVTVALSVAGLPVVLQGLLAAGAVAAALSTAVVSLLAMATVVGHDVHRASLAPSAPPRQRLTVARVLLLVLGVLAAWVAAQRLAEPLAALAWAASFAASGLFFPLLAAVWWRRATWAGAGAGIAFGFAGGALYAYLVQAGGMEPWLGLDAMRFGIVGMVVSLVALVVVSLLTPAPDPGKRLLVEDIRRPYGAPLLPRTH